MPKCCSGTCLVHHLVGGYWEKVLNTYSVCRKLSVEASIGYAQVRSDSRAMLISGTLGIQESGLASVLQGFKEAFREKRRVGPL